MSVTPNTIRALSIKDVFALVSDDIILQFIADSTATWVNVKDEDLRCRLIAQHAADRLYRQMKEEEGTPVDRTPFTQGLEDLQEREKRTRPSASQIVPAAGAFFAPTRRGRR